MEIHDHDDKVEEETDILETEEKKLSKQNLGQIIKAKENIWGIFPSVTTDRTIIDLEQFTWKTLC